MMDDRGIKWVCSRCGASFSTSEALKAHVADEHRARPSKKTPGHDLSKPRVSATESELSSREPREPDADLARRSQPVATGDVAGAKPSVLAVLSEPAAKEPRRPYADLARHTEPDATHVAAGEKPTAPPIPQPRHRSPTSTRRTLRWLAVAAICIATAGLGIAFPHQIAHQVAISVTRQPTPFTEFYFSDHQSLPVSLSLSSPNLFGFTVVNHEGHDTVYSYVVTLVSSHGGATIAQGRIDLRNSMSATRLVNVHPTERTTDYLITVRLLGRTEMIRFRAASQ